MSESLNVMAVVRGGEKYVVIWDDAHASQAALTVRSWVNDADLSLTLREAEPLLKRMGERPAAPKWPLTSRFKAT